MRNKTLIVIISSLVLVLILTGVIILLRRFMLQKGEIFDGYIVWGRESVVFTTNLQIQSNNRVHFLGPKVWVDQNELVQGVYNNALVLTDGPEGSMVLKIKFIGIQDKGGRYGHLGQYDTQVTIKKIIDYSMPTR